MNDLECEECCDTARFLVKVKTIEPRFENNKVSHVVVEKEICKKCFLVGDGN